MQKLFFTLAIFFVASSSCPAKNLIFFSSLIHHESAFAKAMKCQKEAEAVAISESKKRANLPEGSLSIANPTELDGSDVVVYIGARANYNYFKLKFDDKCKLLKIVEVEYAH